MYYENDTAKNVQIAYICGRQAQDPEIESRSFIYAPLVTIPAADAHTLFDETVENTKSYWEDYGV